MFTHRCSDCHRRQLMFLDQATSVTPTAEGFELALTCWCGAETTAVLPSLIATRSTADLAAGDRGLVAA